MSLNLYFFGGAESVTGANYLLEDKTKDKSTNLLVDCGFFQGSKIGEDKNDNSFLYDPKDIDSLVVTHAHIDHIGRIPKLVRDGFRGKIFSTPVTKEFAELMLSDSLGVLKKESRRNNHKILYEKKDIVKALELWESVEYHSEFKIGDFKVILKDAGHILGSSMVEVTTEQGEKIVFSGDLGNSPNPILKNRETIEGANYLIVESTYGDRIHEKRNESKLKLERTIEETIKQKGVLMIPSFSLERTQELLFEINNLVENSKIPKIPIFLDSPLAIKATAIYKKYSRYYNKDAKNILTFDDDLFKFPGLSMTLTTEESKSINDVPSPKIIIAGSGMSNGGRIIHHEKRYLPDPKNKILFVGYQAARSLGRLIQNRVKTVTILGDRIPVRAQTSTLSGYSAHADQESLMEFVYSGAQTLKKVFTTQGELKASMTLAQKIRDNFGIETIVPKPDESFELK